MLASAFVFKVMVTIVTVIGGAIFGSTLEKVTPHEEEAQSPSIPGICLPAQESAPEQEKEAA